MPKVVLVSGLPGTGKWATRNYLERALGFYGVSLGDALEDAYRGEGRVSDPTMRQAKLLEAKQRVLQDAQRALDEGKDIVIEAATPTDQAREELLGPFDGRAEKYIVALTADAEARMTRLKRRPGFTQRMEDPDIEGFVYRTAGQWEDPIPVDGTGVLQHKYNNERDFSGRIRPELDFYFKNYGKE